MRGQDGGEDEGDEGVNVHAELDGGKVVAGEEGEKAIEAGDLVEEERERDEGRTGREGHCIEEFLRFSKQRSWEIRWMNRDVPEAAGGGGGELRHPY